MTQHLEEHIVINALPAAVWEALTNPDLMKQWMGEPEMNIEVLTDWKVGSPLVIRGFHHAKFENRGTVVQCEPGRVLKYNYISSISRLPDSAENYTAVEFRLYPLQGQTSLTLTLDNFPTESILKHVEFYWKTTLAILRRLIETQASDNVAQPDNTKQIVQ